MPDQNKPCQNQAGIFSFKEKSIQVSPPSSRGIAGNPLSIRPEILGIGGEIIILRSSNISRPKRGFENHIE